MSANYVIPRVRLCARCQRLFKTCMRMYGITPYRRRKDKLIGDWLLQIRRGLNGMCWTSGGKCKGDFLPDVSPIRGDLLKAWRADEKKSSRRR